MLLPGPYSNGVDYGMGTGTGESRARLEARAERQLTVQRETGDEVSLLAGTAHGTTVDNELQRQCMALYESLIFIVA